MKADLNWEGGNFKTVESRSLATAKKSKNQMILGIHLSLKI